jgi:3'(2'), 5'-bisphosphate nucleotidase
MEWDSAAPHIIVEEAGGQLVHAESLQSLRYNKESLVNPSFITFPIINY